jgi:hypothetical protein
VGGDGKKLVKNDVAQLKVNKKYTVRFTASEPVYFEVCSSGYDFPG